MRSESVPGNQALIMRALQGKSHSEGEAAQWGSNILVPRCPCQGWLEGKWVSCPTLFDLLIIEVPEYFQVGATQGCPLQNPVPSLFLISVNGTTTQLLKAEVRGHFLFFLLLYLPLISNTSLSPDCSRTQHLSPCLPLSTRWVALCEIKEPRLLSFTQMRQESIFREGIPYKTHLGTVCDYVHRKIDLKLLKQVM